MGPMIGGIVFNAFAAIFAGAWIYGSAVVSVSRCCRPTVSPAEPRHAM